MADDAVTRLIVTGGGEFVKTMTAAADAQDKLTNAIRTASSANPQALGTGIQNLATALVKSNKESATFTELLKITFNQMGLGEEVAQQVTSAIQRQTKALQENARAQEEINKVQAKRAANFQVNANELIAAGPTQAAPPGEVTFRRGQRLTGAGTEELTAQITANIEKQRTSFLQNESKVREAIEERALQAARLRANNRVKIEADATERIIAREGQRAARTAQIAAVQAEKDRVTRLRSSEQTRRQDISSSLFTQAHPEFNAKTTGTLNVNTAAATDQSTKAIRDQGEAMNSTTKNGITYLSSLSAIHAFSFLLTGQTFSSAGSVLTLGLAFSKAAPAGSVLSGVLSGVGASLGVFALGVNLVSGGVQSVIAIVESGAQSLLQFGAVATAAVTAVVVASTKLASSVEDVLAEVAAFGAPTRAQFQGLEADVSGIARAFGQSATSVAQGASLFIRAGGDIKDNIGEAVSAVTRLTIAARGELIPAQSARSIVTITNSFKAFNVTATEAVDVFVGTAQKSALSFSEVTQAFQQAAPTAALLKIPLLDLAATIGVLANEGLRGQVAGTGLKQFLLDLLNPSDKAAAKLRELGISIRDQNNRIRPLVDIFKDMKLALGEQAEALDKTGDASKAQALAVIFGSRANLAAAIIARTGAEAFNEMRTAIAGVSAAEVVEILLSTTSAQVSILKTNVEELARAFGGPLNVAVGTALKTVNGFLQGIDRSGFEAAGKAIIAVFTGGGFGQISQLLGSLDDSQAKTFFNSLLNSALTVRNAFVNQLVPALQTAGTSIAAAFETVDIEGTFGNMTKGALALVSVGSRVITFAGELVSSFIKGDEVGQTLRKTLTGVATAVGTALVGAFISAAVPIIIAVKLLGAVGSATLTLLDNMNQFNSIWEAGWQLAKDSVNNFLKDVAPRLQGLGDVLIGVATRNAEQIERGLNSIKVDQFNNAASQVIQKAGGIDSALIQTSGHLQDLRNRISELEQSRGNVDPIDKALGIDRLLNGATDKELADLNDEFRTTLDVFSTLQRLKQSGATGLPSDNPIISGILQARQEIEALRNSAPINLDDILNFSEGDLPDALTSIAAKLKEIQDIVDAGGRRASDRDPSESGFPDDPNKQAKIEKEINDIIRTGREERADIIADHETRELDLRRSTINKLIDLDTRYNRDKRKIDEDVERKEQESNRDFAQRRSDRNTLQAFQRTQETVSFLREQDHAKRDLLISQEDAADDRRNQRRVQDEDRVLGQLQDRESRAQDVINQIRDRGFQRSQQNEERVFGRRQSAEEVAFNRQLQDQATVRDNLLRLREAKTPEERRDINKQIQQAKENTQFSRSQEEQSRIFRERQEDSRVQFTRKQEDIAFQHTLTNEQAAFEFRIQLELKYLDIKRQLEDVETGRTNQVERQRLLRRLGLQEDDFKFRRDQSDALTREQDRLADEEHARNNQRSRDEAKIRKTELGQRLSEDIFALFDDQTNQSLKNQEQTLKQLRNLGQREERQLRSLGEREPTAFTATQIAITEMNLELLTTDLIIRQNTLDAERFLNTLRLASLVGNNVPTEAPGRRLTITVPDFNPQQQAAINTARVQLDATPLLAQILPPAFAEAIRLAQLTGEGTKTVNIDATQFNNNQLVEMVQQLLSQNR